MSERNVVGSILSRGKSLLAMCGSASYRSVLEQLRNNPSAAYTATTRPGTTYFFPFCLRPIEVPYKLLDYILANGEPDDILPRLTRLCGFDADEYFPFIKHIMKHPNKAYHNMSVTLTQTRSLEVFFEVGSVTDMPHRAILADALGWLAKAKTVTVDGFVKYDRHMREWRDTLTLNGMCPDAYPIPTIYRQGITNYGH